MRTTITTDEEDIYTHLSKYSTDNKYTKIKQ